MKNILTFILNRRKTAMTDDLIFDHLSDSARRVHSFHRRWSVEAFYIQLHAMAALAIASVQARKPNDAYWQAQAAFRFAREIERQDMEFTQRLSA
jgi:hypothetical protein